MSPGLPLVVALVGVLGSLLVSRPFPRLWLGLMLLGGLGALLGGAMILGGAETWDWSNGLFIGGEVVHLRLDALSALFLVLLAVLGSAAGVYSRAYWTEEQHPRSAAQGRTWWSLLMLSFGCVLLQANGLHFLIAWEVFTVSAYFLVTLDRGRRDVRAAGWLYLAASHVGMVFLFAFFAGLASRLGSWELGPMLEKAELAPLFWLALIGFGIKAGLFPLHIWLPSAHANAPSHVSAILSGMALKMGVYGLMRFSGWLPLPSSAPWTVAGLGVVSAVLGVAFALGQHDLKRLLAYHSVENIGIILIGLGFAMIGSAQGHPRLGQLAMAGALLHVWNHGLFKALLFLGAGSVLHATGTREMSRLGGLWRAMPWTAALFALGAIAISGLAPLNGFVSEWLIYLGLFDSLGRHDPTALAAMASAILLAMTGALALACFVKACGVVFLGAPRTSEARRAHEVGWCMRGPMLALACLCGLIGLAPSCFWPSLLRAVQAWQPGWSAEEVSPPLTILGVAHCCLALSALLGAAWMWRWVTHGRLRRAVTWDCGYAVPTPRMQYSAGSFAGTLTEWFSWILCPEKHEQRPEEDFPSEAHAETHTPETVLERVIHPVAGLILLASAAIRRLQQGRLQAYLLYLLLGIAALAVLVAAGGGQ